MNNLKPFTAVIAGLVLGISLPMASQAGMINGSHWLVKSGDNVYSIARNVFPGDSKQQARLRRELVSNNPQVFKGNPDALSVGARLKLPAFATGKTSRSQIAKTPKAIRLPQPRPKQKAAPVKVAHKTVTPDPADSIGKVIINMGDLKAVNRGSVRTLARNSSVLKGDTLKTARNSHTQIRLKDGALISLRPNTEFRIADFRYNGAEDGTERGLFELIKGGFRTITGAIGHRNKQNYRVNTTVATIGIRGTHYGLVLCTDGSCSTDGSNLADGLYGGVVDGAVVASNSTGEFSFTNDEYFLITSQTSTPTPILKPTLVFDGISSDSQLAATDGASSESVATGDTVTSTSSLEIASIPTVELADSATSDILNPPISPSFIIDAVDELNQLSYDTAPSGSAMLTAFSYTDATTGNLNGVGAPVVVTDTGKNVIYLNDQGIPAGAHEESQLQIHELTLAEAVPSSLGSASTIGTVPVAVDVNWGRWEGNYIATEDDVPMEHTQNLHFIYSDHVLDTTALANLNGLGASLTYNVVDGTLATDNLGNVDANLATITMDVNFNTGLVASYDVTTFDGTANSFQGSASNIPFDTLDNSFQLTGITGSCGTATGNCTGEASLAFIGPEAEGAITSYSLTSLDGTSSSSGASLLER